MRDLSARATGVILAICLAVAIAAQVNLQVTFRQVRHPVSLNTANLESDPQVIRDWYAQLMEQDTYLIMIRTELVDFAWAFAMAITVVMIAYFCSALLRRRSPAMSTFLGRWAPLFGIGPLFDVVENCLSLAMLTDPQGFSPAVAVLHVVASWLKISFSVLAATVGCGLTIVGAVRGPAPLRGRVQQEADAIPPR